MSAHPDIARQHGRKFPHAEASRPTAFADAFARAGVTERDVCMRRAMATFRNHGGSLADLLVMALEAYEDDRGSLDEALAVVRAAYETGSGDHRTNAGKAMTPLSAASHTHDAASGHISAAEKAMLDMPGSASTKRSGEGQVAVADKAILGSPSAAATERNRAGQASLADKAIERVPRPVSPAYLVAARGRSQEIARSVLDSFRVRDGRAIGDVFMADLPALEAANNREAILVRLLQRHVANPPLGARVRDIVKAADLEKMIQKSAELSDVA